MIALCLSGEARCLEKGYKEIQEKVLQDCNHDVFVHTWSTWQHLKNKGKADKEKITKLYNPKDIIFEDKINSYKKINWGKIKTKPNNNVCSMYYSVMRSNELRNQHSVKNNIKYDIVIRSRFDLFFTDKIKFDVKENVAYVCGPPRGKNIRNDFVFGSAKVMDIFCNCYHKIIELGKVHSETLATQNFKKNGVEIKQTGVNIMYFRPSGKIDK